MDTREPIVVMGDQGSFGGCAKLVEAFNQCSTMFRATLITRLPDPYAPTTGLLINRDHEKIGHLLNQCSKIFFCDWSALVGLARYLQRRLRKRASWMPWKPGWKLTADWMAGKDCVFYWTGTPYAREYRIVNKAISPMGFQTYVMPGLATRDRNALPLLQCHQIEPEPLSKEPSASHSPGKKRKSDEKGTNAIATAFKKLEKSHGLQWRIISGASNKRAIRLKAGSWFFVDRIKCWGGLGKSGAEAMMLGSPTLCDLQGTIFEGYYAGCPVIDCRSQSAVLREGRALIMDDTYRLEMARETAEWARRLRYMPTIRYLESTLRWCQ